MTGIRQHDKVFEVSQVHDLAKYIGNYNHNYRFHKYCSCHCLVYSHQRDGQTRFEGNEGYCY